MGVPILEILDGPHIGKMTGIMVETSEHPEKIRWLAIKVQGEGPVLIFEFWGVQIGILAKDGVDHMYG